MGIKLNKDITLAFVRAYLWAISNNLISVEVKKMFILLLTDWIDIEFMKLLIVKAYLQVIDNNLAEEEMTKLMELLVGFAVLEIVVHFVE